MRTYLLATALFAPSLLAAQTTPRDIARERAERIHWLAVDPMSPARAVALAELGPTGISLGPDGSDVPLSGRPLGTIMGSGTTVTLTGWGPDHPLPFGHATLVQGIRFELSGVADRVTVRISQDAKPGARPVFYPYRASARFIVALRPGALRATRILEPLGTTVAATEVGTVSFILADTERTLHVMRIAGEGEESELLINFRDGTTGAGTYPAGRFVELIPQGGDKYILDFNRAFNPNCAYSGVFPCPIPWAGNSVTAKIAAGEKYPPEHLH